MRDKYFQLAIAFIVLCIGVFLFPFDFLNPFSINWIWGSGDFEQHFLGWQFFQREPLVQIPLSKLSLYGDGVAQSIVFTDSIPLIAVPLKYLLSQSGLTVQYFGLFVLSSLVLQALLAYSYFRRLGVHPVVGSMLSLVVCIAPALLFRATCHTSLTAQWVIIASLFLCRSRGNQWFNWLALLSLSLWIHLYLFVMCSVLFFANLPLGKLLKQRRFFWVSGIAVLILLQAYLLGYIPRTPSDATSSGYGIFTFNLLAPLSSQSDFSLILPDLDLPYGSHEGFAFFGPIFLLSIVIVASFKQARKIFMNSVLSMNKRVLLALLVMAAFAISPVISLGNYSVDLGRLPYPLFILGDTFRASGRFIWPLYYFLMLEALAAIGLFCLPQARSLGSTRGRLRLCAFLALIIIALGDLSGYAGARRAQFSSKSDAMKPAIDAIQASIKSISGGLPKSYIFYPNTEAPHGFDLIARLALLNHSSTNGAYLARYDNDLILRQNLKAKNELYNQKLDREAVYIIGELKERETALLPPICTDQPNPQLDSHCLLEVESMRLLIPVSLE